MLRYKDQRPKIQFIPMGLYKGLALLVCAALLLCSLSLLPADRVITGVHANGVATITLSPTPAMIAGCETISVQIMVNNVTDLYGADVRLSFDPAVLEVVDDLPDSGVNIQPLNTFLTKLWIAKNEANNTAGTIWYAVTQLNPALPVSGSGAVATIHFKAKSAGTTDLTFTYTKLADMHGVQITAEPTNGSVQTSNAFAPTLAISRLNSTTARLSWGTVSDATAYHLYRATTPYFNPADPALYVGSGIQYDDTTALGDVNVQHYYTLKAACANEFKSEISNRVGEYDFALRSASTFNYNDISMVFNNASITKASHLASYVGSSVSE